MNPFSCRAISSEPKKYALYLNLDPAVSLPIALKDVRASQSFLDGLDGSARNPTGKFYKDQHAIALVDTLAAQGNYARVTLNIGSSDEHRQHFERFIARLQGGELVRCTFWRRMINSLTVVSYSSSR